MKKLTKPRTTTLLFIPLALACSALLPNAQAALPPPPPDGGFGAGNTAEGTNALFNRTTGAFDTAIGADSLLSLTIGSSNTAVGTNSLKLLTSGGSNTAVGVAALQNNNGSHNTALGVNALFSNTTGDFNTGVGQGPLSRNTTGSGNVAVGFQALSHNTTTGQPEQGSVAVGYQALFNATGNVSGQAANNAVGQSALFNDTTGAFNNAFGWDALFAVTTGADNTAVGNDACGSTTTASGNVCIGSEVAGDNAGNHTFIRNINTTAQAASAGTVDFVTVNLTSGLLGHGVSSRRYKEDIKPMDNASQLLYRLKPVTYHYKKDVDPNQNLDYGLVAEDVAAVDPKLAVRDGKGQIENVRYNAIYNMMLNEFLKEHKTVQELKSIVAKQEAIIAQQQKGMEVLTATVKEQAAQIQKVSAQIEMSKPAPTVVVNTP